MSAGQTSQNLTVRTLRNALPSALHNTVARSAAAKRAGEPAAESHEPVMRRIAIVLPELGLRGSVRQMITLAATLANRGHDLAICDPGGVLERGVDALEDLPNVRRLKWQLGSKRTAKFLSKRNLLKRIANFEPDIVHVGTLSWPSPWREISQRLDSAVVATVHSTTRAARIDAGDLRLCDRLIAVSHDVRESLVNRGGVPREMIDLVFPGVRSVSKDLLDARYAKRSSMVPVVACVGPLSDRAGLRTLLRAASLLRAARAKVQILIVGDGEQASFVREWIEEYDLGYLVVLATELYSYEGIFDVADIALITSESHDAGQFALDAMSRGVPPLLSGSGGNFELVADQRTGLIYDAASPDSLANAILELSASYARRHELGVAAWEVARTQRTVEQMALGVEAAYESAILLTQGL